MLKSVDSLPTENNMTWVPFETMIRHKVLMSERRWCKEAEEEERNSQKYLFISQNGPPFHRRFLLNTFTLSVGRVPFQTVFASEQNAVTAFQDGVC